MNFSRSEDLRKIGNLLAARAVPMIASIATTFITAALLGPAGRGQLAIVVSTSSLVGALTFLSLHVGMVDGVRRGDSHVVRRGLRCLGIMCGVVATAAIVASLVSPQGLGGSFTSATVGLCGVGGALTLANLAVLRTVQGLGGHLEFRNALIIQAVLYLVTAVPLTLWTREALPAILAWMVSSLVSTVMGLRALRATVPHSDGPVADVGRMLRRSLPGHLGSSGQQLLHSGDVVILGALAGSAAVGTYSIAAAMAGLVWLVSEALSLATFDSGVTTRSVKEDKALYRRYSLIHLAAATVAAGCVLVASFTLIPLILPDYEGLPILVAILLPGVLAQGQARLALARFTTNGDARAASAVGVSSAVLAIGYVPFIASGATVGAALGSSVLYITQTVIVLFISRRHRSVLQDTAPGSRPKTGAGGDAGQAFESVAFNTAAPSVAVVIVAFRSAMHLEACLAALGNDDSITAITIVDNSSDVETERLVHRLRDGDPRLQLVQPGSNLGFARGCNLGVARSPSVDYIVFLNPDTVPTKSLGHLAALLRSSTQAIAAGRLVSGSDASAVNARPLPTQGREILKALLGARAYGSERSRRGTRNVGQVDGALLVISSADLHDLDGFDDRFELYYEDVDLCNRALRIGGCLFVDEVWGRHVGGASFETASSSAFTALRISRTRYFRKHLGGRSAGSVGAGFVAIVEWLARTSTRQGEGQATRNRALRLQWRELRRPQSVIVLEGAEE